MLVVANEDGYSRSGRTCSFPGDGVAEHFVFSPDGIAGRVRLLDADRAASGLGARLRRPGESRKLTDLGRVEDGVEPTLHRFESFDGESIPVFLFPPEGDGPFPVVVTVHGGPEASGSRGTRRASAL